MKHEYCFQAVDLQLFLVIITGKVLYFYSIDVSSVIKELEKQGKFEIQHE